MKKVPFYGNHDDDLHCAVAVQRILFDYFMDRKLSWEEMENMAGFKPDKAAWTVTIWERMSKQGFDIRMIEPFDYVRYLKEGETYLRVYYKKNPKELEWQLKTSNLLEVRPLIASFRQEIEVESKRPTLDDIDDMLHDERLVFLTLNAKALDGQEGANTHAVLVVDKEGDDYIIHDPGLPPQPYRRVPSQKLWEAMGKEDSTSEATGIKFKPRLIRADQLLANMHPMYSRAALAKLFSKGLIQFGDKVLKAGERVLSNSVLTAGLSSLIINTATIDLPVIYEDDDVLVINKPTGVLTHVHGSFNSEATVSSFLRQHVTELTGERAGIVHRLDRPTSGIIICAKNNKALSFLQKQFADRKAKKTYAAIVEGHLKQQEAIVDMPIERNPKAPATFRVGPNGKAAVTQYKVIEESKKASLLELKPETGRTHQLRVHMLQLGHPIIGDPLYGKGKHGDRMYLHAHRLELTLPGQDKPTVFTAPLPKEFSAFMAL